MTILLAKFLKEKTPTTCRWVSWVVYIQHLSIEKGLNVGGLVKSMLPVRLFSRSAYFLPTAPRCLFLQALKLLPAVRVPI